MERSFRSRDVDVSIRERGSKIELALDGIPIEVEKIDGEYHSQLANQFIGFKTIDEIVDVLLANEGRTWTLHGEVAPGHPHGGPQEPGHHR